MLVSYSLLTYFVKRSDIWAERILSGLYRQLNLKCTHYFEPSSIWLVKQDIIFMLVTFFVYRMSWLLQVWNMDLITAHLLDGMRSVLFVCVKILNWLLKIPSSYSVLIEYCFPLIKQRLVSCLKISFSVWVSKKRKHQSGKGMSIVK